jgi:CheY-like chemotaxis protein
MIKCLYIEDNKKHAKNLKAFLESAWAAASKRERDIEIDVVGEYAPAHERLQSGSALDLLIVDLELDKSFTLAINLIKEAARGTHRPGIIVLSSYVNDPNHKKEIKDAKEAGADELIDKVEIFNGTESDESVGEKMMRSFQNRRGPSQNTPLRPRREIDRNAFQVGLGETDELSTLILKVDLHSIGIDTVLIPICAEICGEGYDRFLFRYLKPGISGAYVFQLTASSQRGNPDLSLLLKVSRNREALEREVTRFPKQGEPAHKIYVSYLTQQSVLGTDGWFAIAADFQSGAKTLLDWVIYHQGVPDLSNRLRGLFSGPLREDVRQSTKIGITTGFDALFPNPMRVSRILLALKRFSPIAEQQSKLLKIPYRADLLQSFLIKRRIGELYGSNLTSKATTCLSHGDFHSRNILISESDETIRIIDPAERDEWHWAGDVARLLVDLLVSAYHSGLEAYDTNLIPEWYNLALATVVGRDWPLPSTNLRNEAVRLAVKWCRENLGNIYSVPSHQLDWEFQLAFAIELLRSTYRSDETPAKRAFAFIAAAAALEKCEQTYQQGGK